MNGTEVNPNDLMPDRIEVHYRLHPSKEEYVLGIARSHEGNLAFKVNDKPFIVPDEDANRAEYFCRDMARLIAAYLNRQAARRR